jgi:hypothetical protein
MIYNSHAEVEVIVTTLVEVSDLIAVANGNRVKRDFNVGSVSNVFLPVKT